MKITIPTTLREMTVEQFMKYTKLLAIKGLTDNELKIGTVAIFCNLSTSDVIKFPNKDLNEAFEIINKALQEKPVFLQTYEDLGFIPNLDEITSGEYFDLDKYFHDPDNFHRAMSVMYRPIEKKKGDTYTLTPYNGTEETAEERLKLPLDLFLGTKVFFWTLEKDLLTATIQSLQKPSQEGEELAADLKKNGVGIHQYTQSLTNACSILTKLLH